MKRIFRYLAYAVGAVVLLLVIGAVLAYFLFDPNDFKQEVEARVQQATGRELTIEGDLGLSLFPWLAITTGHVELGNAEGFGDEPMVEFDSANLRVRLMPLLFGGDIEVGTAELDGLNVNLAIDGSGRNNWDDLSDAGDAAADAETDDSAGSGGGRIDIAGVRLGNARLLYVDARNGDRVELSEVNLASGRIAAGESVPLDGELAFRIEPAGIGGRVDIDVVARFDDASLLLDGLDVSGEVDGLTESTAAMALSAPAISLDTAEQVASPGELSMRLFDVEIDAAVEPFSWAGSPTPRARLGIAAFSPRSLLQSLAIAVPETADPEALGLLRLDANAVVSDDAIRLADLVMVLDETTLRGELSVPRSSAGHYRLNLEADSIDLNRYMAPAGDAAAAGGADGAAVEIPTDLLRPLRAQGKVTVATARMGPLDFSNVTLEVNAADGKLRAHPVRADFLDGSYQGDTRIDVTGAAPVLSVDERIEGVSLNALARAMFGEENVTGTIDGRFTLSGRGDDMEAVRRTLAGNMNFTLADGAWEGTDIWYELRRARAVFRQEEPPEPELPPRTRFSEVTATGVVTNGIMKNDDFVAEMPFMRLTGNGTVNFVEATIDYAMRGQVFEKPELQTGVSDEELADLTKTVIPFRISGPLADPKIGVDMETLLRDRVRRELEDRVEDELKDKLRDLFGD